MIITGLTGTFVVNWLIAQWAGSSTTIVLGHPAWRWMFWVQVVPSAIFLISLLMIPESPRFLVARGAQEKAEAVLARLFGADASKAKVAEINASLATDHHRPRLSDLFDHGRVRPIVWAGIGLAVFQQLVGINVVFYYGAVLWQSVGFSEADSLKINILSGTLSIVACLISMGFVDKIGRKPILLFGSIGMAVTLATVAFAFSSATLVNGQAHLPQWAGLTALIAANLYVVFFNGTWGPVMWVMLGEMFPNQIRGSGLAVAGFAQWIANFGISVSFPWLAENLGLVITYAFYAASALISFFFVMRAVRETRGRELEDMPG
jgi:SP family sugar:H+ symporter-like MFS transporter